MSTIPANIYQIISDEVINLSASWSNNGWQVFQIQPHDHPGQFPYNLYGINIQATGTWHHDYRPTRMLLSFKPGDNITRAALIDAEGEVIGLFEPYESSWSAQSGNVTIVLPITWGVADLSRLYVSAWDGWRYLRRIDFDFREPEDLNTEWGSIIWTPAGGFLS